jgi:hypothetical protein
MMAIAGCSATDYQLGYTLTGAGALGGNYVRVYYSLSNDGNRDLVNATLQVTVTARNAAGGSLGSASAWTAMKDLSVGESFSSYVDVYFSTGTPNTVDTYLVTAVGWDDSGSTGIF